MAIQERKGWKHYPVQVAIGLVVAGQAVFTGYAEVRSRRASGYRSSVSIRAAVGRKSSGHRVGGSSAQRVSA